MLTFKRCFPKGGWRWPYVVGKVLSFEEISSNFNKSPEIPETFKSIKVAEPIGNFLAISV